ncbi:hypothetical protein PHYC_03454 [Phycisphaerales bacterium]|nr:hypothetical protein PHYC_03454 [Phycisphaerales bacterium]
MTLRFLIIALVLTLSRLALGVPPSDAEIDAAIEKSNFKAPEGKPQRARYEQAREAFEGISLLEASRAQIERISRARVLILLPTQWDESKVRLAQLAEDDSVEGARAAELLIGVSNRPRTADPAVLEAHPKMLSGLIADALKHPKISAALEQGYCTGIVLSLPSLRPEDLKKEGMIEAIESITEVDLPARPALALAGVFDRLADPEFGANPKVLERFRGKALAMLNRCIKAGEAEIAGMDAELAKSNPGAQPPHDGAKPSAPEVINPGQAGPDPGDQAALRTVHDQTVNMMKYVKLNAEFLNGAFARGNLMGKPAPEIKFLWSSKDGVKSLADYKGNVLVLQFWATRYGNCVATFPDVRALWNHYKASPVAILGITSVQGVHQSFSKEDSSATMIDTAGNPAQEFELMAEFIRKMDVSWDVAFGDAPVFNPEFGVRGVPHVVVIDPDGIVRHRALDLRADPDGVRQAIDGLLREFKLPLPPAPSEPPTRKDEPTPSGPGG